MVEPGGRRSSLDSEPVPLGLSDLRFAVHERVFGGGEPARFGRYEAKGALGRGATGSVLEAWDGQLQRRVALKVLHADDGRGARLLREAQALARLSHPNVVQVYEVGQAQGQLYLAMELIDGTTLREALASEPRSARWITSAFAAAARGLAAAHTQGIVHRDFKPDNVLVDRDGGVKVADFGLALGTAAKDPTGEQVELGARGAGAGSRSGSAPDADPDALNWVLTQTGAVLGTPAYMAPEQLRDGEAGPAADQYALCVALFEAFVGARPERATSEDPTLPPGAVQLPRRRPPAIPRRVWRVIQRGLQQDPDARCADTAELARELESAGSPPAAHRGAWLRVPAAIAGPTIGVGLALYLSSDRPEPPVTRPADATAIQDAVLSRAEALLPTDPTAALQHVRELDALDREWGPRLRRIVATAESTGVVDRRVPLPGGAEVVAMRGSQAIVKFAGSDAPLQHWDLDAGLRTELLPGHLRSWSTYGAMALVANDQGDWLLRSDLSEAPDLLPHPGQRRAADLNDDGSWASVRLRNLVWSEGRGAASPPEFPGPRGMLEHCHALGGGKGAVCRSHDQLWSVTEAGWRVEAEDVHRAATDGRGGIYLVSKAGHLRYLPPGDPSSAAPFGAHQHLASDLPPNVERVYASGDSFVARDPGVYAYHRGAGRRLISDPGLPFVRGRAVVEDPYALVELEAGWRIIRMTDGWEAELRAPEAPAELALDRTGAGVWAAHPNELRHWTWTAPESSTTPLSVRDLDSYEPDRIWFESGEGGGDRITFLSTLPGWWTRWATEQPASQERVPDPHTPDLRDSRGPLSVPLRGGRGYLAHDEYYGAVSVCTDAGECRDTRVRVRADQVKAVTVGPTKVAWVEVRDAWVWDPAGEEPPARFDLTPVAGARVALSPDESRVSTVTMSAGGWMYRAWDLDTRALVDELKLDNPTARTSDALEYGRWDLRTIQHIDQLVYAGPDTVLVVDSLPPTHRIHVIRDDEHKVWSLERRAQSVAGHPSGLRAAVGSGIGRLQVVDLEDGSARSVRLGVETWPSALAYGPDGESIVAVAPKTQRLWKVDDDLPTASGALLDALKGSAPQTVTMARRRRPVVAGSRVPE